MAFCGNCGQEVQDTALFCQGCGSKTGAAANNAARKTAVPPVMPPLPQAAPVTSVPPPAASVPISVPVSGSGKGAGLAIFSLLLVFIGGILNTVGWILFDEAVHMAISASRQGSSINWTAFEEAVTTMLIAGIIFCAGMILAGVSLYKQKSKPALVACIIGGAFTLIISLYSFLLGF